MLPDEPTLTRTQCKGCSSRHLGLPLVFRGFVRFYRRRRAGQFFARGRGVVHCSIRPEQAGQAARAAYRCGATRKTRPWSGADAGRRGISPKGTCAGRGSQLSGAASEFRHPGPRRRGQHCLAAPLRGTDRSEDRRAMPARDTARAPEPVGGNCCERTWLDGSGRGRRCVDVQRRSRRRLPCAPFHVGAVGALLFSGIGAPALRHRGAAAGLRSTGPLPRALDSAAQAGCRQGPRGATGGGPRLQAQRGVRGRWPIDDQGHGGVRAGHGPLEFEYLLELFGRAGEVGGHSFFVPARELEASPCT